MDDYNYILLGHDAIDKQHRILLGLLAACKKTLESGDPTTIRVVIYDLIKYSLEHFRYEEESMIHLKYNKELYLEHIRQHALFKTKMIEATKNIDDRAVSIELISYLQAWILEHIKVTDQKFVDYYNSL